MSATAPFRQRCGLPVEAVPAYTDAMPFLAAALVQDQRREDKPAGHAVVLAMDFFDPYKGLSQLGHARFPI